MIARKNSLSNIERKHVQHDIVLDNVDVIRGDAGEGVPILKNLHLRIAQGEWVSIVGSNGCGKSTLAQLIAGILNNYSGAFERGFLPPIIPYVMQQPLFFGATPWEDIVFLLELRSKDPLQIPVLAHQALTAVGLTNVMHQAITKLSGGQQQLTAIAGCIAAEAPLLLLDEATSMLDSNSRKLVVAAIRSLHEQGTSVIWFTHHMEELEAGKRVVALEQGRIVYDGTVIDFFYGDEFRLQSSPCELLGFIPPFPVQVAHQLLQQGVPLQSLPLTPAQLAKAVAHYA